MGLKLFLWNYIHCICVHMTIYYMVYVTVLYNVYWMSIECLFTYPICVPLTTLLGMIEELALNPMSESVGNFWKIHFISRPFSKVSRDFPTLDRGCNLENLFYADNHESNYTRPANFILLTKKLPVGYLAVHFSQFHVFLAFFFGNFTTKINFFSNFVNCFFYFYCSLGIY